MYALRSRRGSFMNTAPRKIATGVHRATPGKNQQPISALPLFLVCSSHRTCALRRPKTDPLLGVEGEQNSLGKLMYGFSFN